MEPPGSGVVAEIAVDDRPGPSVVGVVLVDPLPDAVPALVVELGLRGQSGDGVDEKPLLVLWRLRIVPPREALVGLSRGQQRAPLSLLLLGVGDPLQRSVGW